ncbi:MAG: NAD(P)-binding oxidoreductase [Bdellovibrionota bacterium]
MKIHMANILICGGTGFVGSAIAKKLTDQHQVKVLTRSAHPKNPIAGVHYVQGDISSVSDLEHAMENCDVVINAAQFNNAPFENPKKNLTYEKVDAEGTENVVAASKKMNISQILYISGAGVEEGKTENWFVAKLRAEKSIRNSGIQLPRSFDRHGFMEKVIMESFESNDSNGEIFTRRIHSWKRLSVSSRYI